MIIAKLILFSILIGSNPNPAVTFKMRVDSPLTCSQAQAQADADVSGKAEVDKAIKKEFGPDARLEVTCTEIQGASGAGSEADDESNEKVDQ